MPRYSLTTLIDITRTNIGRLEIDEKKRLQQGNFNSLIQAIGLRANPEWIEDPKKNDGRLPDPFSGKGTYWTWEFSVEREDVFLLGNDPVGLLLEDLHGVPIVTGLDDTIDICPAVFDVSRNINTKIEVI
jgi:hypothetical protein